MGDKFDDKYIVDKLKLIDNFVIMGGEPLHQSLNEVIGLLQLLVGYDKKIWFYTSYEIDEVPNEIKQYCNYIKTGRYVEELRTDKNIQYGIQLATSNQKIYKMEEFKNDEISWISSGI